MPLEDYFWCGNILIWINVQKERRCTTGKNDGQVIFDDSR